MTATLTTLAPRRIAPGPRGNVLVGVLPALKRDALKLLSSLAREYGGVVRFRVGPAMTFHLVTDPAGVQQILVDNNRNYGKQTRGFEKLRLVLGQGLLTSEGDFWRRQRRIAQPAFHKEKIRRFADQMVAATLRMLDRWEARQATPAGAEPVDAGPSAAAHLLGRAAHRRPAAAVEPALSPRPALHGPAGVPADRRTPAERRRPGRPAVHADARPRRRNRRGDVAHPAARRGDDHVRRRSRDHGQRPGLDVLPAVVEPGRGAAPARRAARRPGRPPARL